MNPSFLYTPRCYLAMSVGILMFCMLGCSDNDSDEPVTETLVCNSPQELNDTRDDCIDPVVDLFEASPNQAVIYYQRADGNYREWGLHLWDATGAPFTQNSVIGAAGTEWPNPLPHAGVSDTYGAYYVINFESADWTNFRFIMHGTKEANRDSKDLGGLDQTFIKASVGSDLFTFEGNATLYPDPLKNPPVAIEGAKAHWLSANLIAYNPAGVSTTVSNTKGASTGTVRLHHAPTANMVIDVVSGPVSGGATVSGGTTVELTATQATAEIIAAFPHLSGYSMWSVPASVEVKSVLKNQLIVTYSDSDGVLTEATKVQLRGVLDNIYAKAASHLALGASTQGTTQFALWAPTAQHVELRVYDAGKSLVSTHGMVEDSSTGVWTYDSGSDLSGSFYRYRVTVYHYLLDSVETFTTTDPYSLSLSTNSEYTQVVNLNDSALMPVGWVESAADTPYVVANPEDISVYETHIRDFSSSDSKGTAAYHGKYLAYTETARDSVAHLQALRDAGLTHVHLLPVFDIATIEEDPAMRADLGSTKGEFCALNPNASLCATTVDDTTTLQQVMAAYEPAGGEAQALMNDLRGFDSFNWGYDPFHYTTPEGSYSTNPEGSDRILEFRAMVKALHDMGLNVVMDVVYNHTNASGNADKSVLDKIVPGYYHRLNPESGEVEKSTCCDNTATEAAMFQKLMEDSLVVWARDYQVDGFRFDLMGHHPKQGILNALRATQAVRSHIYFYGEGWNFGEVANDAQFEQATQLNMAGTKIGTFSDRLRDAVRGGGPFDSGISLRSNQGFASGLYHLPNELSAADESSKARLLAQTDLIRIGMAANLEGFVLETHTGLPALGKQLDYNGQPAGYTKEPADVINYVSKHDNQTLWDNNQYKIATGTSTENRVRMQLLALAVPLLSQGIPFLHMGSDMLRSKSMQRDSFDSGDWFNRVDFTYQHTNWNVGLPREDKDGDNWPVISSIIADANAEPATADIVFATAVFRDLLAIRSSSKLFRLATGEDIKARVDFSNTGLQQIPGVIVMTLDDGVGLDDLDPGNDAITVIINATFELQTVTVAGAAGFELHGTQAAGADTVVMSSVVNQEQFSVPALTAAIFVKPQGAEQGEGLAIKEKDLTAIPPYGSTRIYLRGSMNGFDTSEQMNFVGSDRYETSIELVAGSYSFKIADTNWSNPNLGGDQSVTLGEPLALIPGGGGDIGVAIDISSSVLFTLHAVDTDAPVVTVTAEPL